VKKKRKAGEGMITESLEAFLASPLANRAGQGLSSGALVALHVDGEDFYFRRKNGVNTLGRVEVGKPDIHFWLRLAGLRYILELAELPSAGIASLGVAIFEQIFTKDEERKIKFRLDCGFFALWAKGYFSVLKAGGPEVASYLARSGFDGLSAIKKMIKNTVRSGGP
jgi:hypothetical protein